MYLKFCICILCICILCIYILCICILCICILCICILCICSQERERVRYEERETASLAEKQIHYSNTRQNISHFHLPRKYLWKSKKLEMLLQKQTLSGFSQWKATFISIKLDRWDPDTAAEFLINIRHRWTWLWILKFISPNSWILFLSGFYFLRILVRPASEFTEWWWGGADWDEMRKK